MNKTLIAAAVSAAVAAPVASADITVYGRVNNAIDLNDLSANADSESTTDISTVASRFGLKGSTDLGNGLTVHGQYEFSTSSDKETGPNDVRVASAGVSGSFGRLDVGNLWSAYNKTFGTLVSPTYTLGYYLYADVGGGLFRASNTIQYSNSWGPVGAVLDIRLNDADEGTDVAETVNGNGWGLGVTYQVTPSIALAAAYDVDDFNSTGNDSARVLTITAQPADTTIAMTDHGDGILALASVDSSTQTDLTREETRLGIAGRWDIGAGYWLNVGWQNHEREGYNVAGTVSAAATGVDVDDDGDSDADDDGNVGGFTVTDGGIAANATGTVTRDDSDVDTYFIYGGGPIGQKTSWLLGYASGNNGLDLQSGLDIDPITTTATDDANQLVWGLYHNVGGGLRFYYEAISLENENNNQDGERHLLGIRVDF